MAGLASTSLLNIGITFDFVIIKIWVMIILLIRGKKSGMAGTE